MALLKMLIERGSIDMENKHSSQEKPRELRVKPIKNGTVIDHIAGGQALNVLKILADWDDRCHPLRSHERGERKARQKDIVKVEDRELLEEEVNRIALIAPAASINIIRDYEVIEKRHVDLPDEIVEWCAARIPTASPIPRSPSNPECWSRAKTRFCCAASTASSPSPKG